jgi:hypothetical protein
MNDSFTSSGDMNQSFKTFEFVAARARRPRLSPGPGPGPDPVAGLAERREEVSDGAQGVVRRRGHDAVNDPFTSSDDRNESFKTSE